jgi:hypothetical protein
MPAKSKKQRKAMGIAYAAKCKGKNVELKGSSKEMSEMSCEDLRDYAKTKEKGLPKSAEDYYWAGVARACVERGVDPEVVIKEAAEKSAIVGESIQLPKWLEHVRTPPRPTPDLSNIPGVMREKPRNLLLELLEKLKSAKFSRTPPRRPGSLSEAWRKRGRLPNEHVSQWRRRMGIPGPAPGRI